MPKWSHFDIRQAYSRCQEKGHFRLKQRYTCPALSKLETELGCESGYEQGRHLTIVRLDGFKITRGACQTETETELTAFRTQRLARTPRIDIKNSLALAAPQ